MNFTIQNNFLTQSEYDDLTNTHLLYNRVHWIGVDAKPENALHKLVQKITPESNCKGATAWYNIRPINPKPHNDIDSYCTQNGIQHYPSVLPETTHIYYISPPKIGGQLELETREMVSPKKNMLVSFPINLSHRVLPYEGNRVSVGFIYWPELPSIYGDVKRGEIKIFKRIWEIEDEKS